MSRFDDELRQAASRLAREPLPADILDEALDAQPRRTRWPAVAAASVTVLLVAVAAGVGLGEVLPSPTDSPSPSVDSTPVAESTPSATPGPVSVSVEEHGIRLTLTLDRGEIQSGGRVWADVVVENIGDDSVGYSYGCGQGGSPVLVRAIHPAGGGRQYGRPDWPGDAGELKRQTVDPGAPPSENFTPEEFVDRGPYECLLVLLYDTIAPGDSIAYRGAWDADPAAGAWPGEYAVEATFEFEGRGEEPRAVDVEGQGLRVSTPLLVTGSDTDPLSLGEAMDRLLEDETFQGLLARFPSDRWHPPTFGFDAGGYDLSLLIAGLESPDPVDAISARVDAFTGEVLGVSLHSETVAQPTPPPAEPITQTAEDLGIRLTVTLDRQRTVHGQRVAAVATVENAGEGSVFWGHSGTCVFPVQVAAHSDEPVPIDLGREDWPGDLGILKDVSVNHWIAETELGFGFQPEAWLDSDATGGCTSDFHVSELRAGESVEHRVAWDTFGHHDMPPDPGSYTVDAAFSFMSRGAAPVADESIDEFAVRVAIPLTVEGAEVEWRSPGQAMDALLGDPTFLEHLADAPRGRWTNQTLRFDRGMWAFALYLTETDLDSEVVEGLLARVDAVTGEVLDVRFDPDARPPGFVGEP